MALLPILQLIAGESLTSYMNRIAKTHGNLSLAAFLRFFEISQEDLLGPRLDTLVRISDLTGQPVDDLKKMSFMRLGDRQVIVNEEIVDSQFFDLSKRPFCAACLLEDLEVDRGSHCMPIGRLEWQMEPVRVCGKHCCVLQVHKVTRNSDRFRLLPELSADRAALQNMMLNVVEQQPSRLHQYVTDRIAGIPGPDWLDGQPMDQAARACEMLGVIRVVGTHVDLRAVTDAQWSEADDLGFSYAVDGVDGIKTGLQSAHDNYLSKNAKGGPQMAFGRLYQWL